MPWGGGVPGSGTPPPGGVYPGPGTPPGGYPGQVPPRGGTQVWVPPWGVLPRSGYPPGGVPMSSYPPRGGVPMSGYPPGGYPDPPWGGYPGRTTEGVLTTRRAVCLLRSRRRTFLFVYFLGSKIKLTLLTKNSKIKTQSKLKTLFSSPIFWRACI